MFSVMKLVNCLGLMKSLKTELSISETSIISNCSLNNSLMPTVMGISHYLSRKLLFVMDRDHHRNL